MVLAGCGLDVLFAIPQPSTQQPPTGAVSRTGVKFPSPYRPHLALVSGHSETKSRARTDRRTYRASIPSGRSSLGEIVPLGQITLQVTARYRLDPRRTRNTREQQIRSVSYPYRNILTLLGHNPPEYSVWFRGGDPFTRVLLRLLRGWLSGVPGIVERRVNFAVCHQLVGDVLRACRFFPRGCAGRPTGAGAALVASALCCSCPASDEVLEKVWTYSLRMAKQILRANPALLRLLRLFRWGAACALCSETCGVRYPGRSIPARNLWIRWTSPFCRV